MTETYGVYGSGLTYDQMRFVAGFQTIRGVTLINPMTVSYARKAFMLTGEHPTFAENQACHRDLGVFNAYLERLSYICTRGERVCDTALYYPVNDYWGMANADNAAEEFDRLGFAMEADGVDFDIFDDDIVSMAEDIDSGIIKVGKAAYRKLVIPSCAYIPEKTAELLKRFENGGGKIFHTADGIDSEVRVLSDTAEIRTMKRVTDSGEMLILFNESTEKCTVKLSIGSEKGYIIDITAGELYDIVTESCTASVTLESGETIAVYLTDESLDSRPMPECSDLCGLTDFTFRRVESYVIGDVYAENRKIEESSVPVKLGDWSYITGRDFSGSCIYTTTFSGTDTDTILDLGEVRYSCEAILNGRSLGVKVMKPYRFDVPKEYMADGENKLEIRVSNTPGNQHQFTKSFDNWGSWQHTPYRDRQDIFDAETLDSGLYGPVKIYKVR